MTIGQFASIPFLLALHSVQIDFFADIEERGNNYQVICFYPDTTCAHFLFKTTRACIKVNKWSSKFSSNVFFSFSNVHRKANIFMDNADELIGQN